MPTIATVVDLGEAGGLMSYGPDVADTQAHQRTAACVAVDLECTQVTPFLAASSGKVVLRR